MRNDTLGKQLPFDEIAGHFKAPEGEANLYYGLIRSGKTYGATADILEELGRGRIVYATWPVHVDDTDDRNSLFFLLRGILLPWKKRYYQIPQSENFHFINAETGEVDGVRSFDPNAPGEYIDYLNSLNHCSLYIDEAWRVLAHTLVDKETRAGSYNLILVTGHKFRTVNLIAQRTMAIQPMARANMGRFYRFNKIGIFGLNIFLRTEFQHMKGEDVDESDEAVISRKWYIGSQRVYRAYNSWFYGDLNPLHALRYSAADLSYGARLYGLLRLCIPSSLVHSYSRWRETPPGVPPASDLARPAGRASMKLPVDWGSLGASGCVAHKLSPVAENGPAWENECKT